MMCHRIGLPPISTIGLGRTGVSSLSREPKPPARITAFTRRVYSSASMEADVAEPQSYGQFGEDRILEEIFSDRTNGYCVEIGADDGRTGSATYLFEQIPVSVEEIRRHRTCTVVNCAVSNREGEATF